MSCLNVANLALCGSPFLAGFYSKDLILENCFFLGGGWFVLFFVFLATGLTASYSVRFSLLSLWGEFKFFCFHNVSDDDLFLVVPVIFLTCGAIFGGAFLSWFLFSGFFLVIPFLLKLMALIVTVLGAVLGWFLSCRGGGFSVVKERSFFVFSSAFIWFLVDFSTQVLLGVGL